MQEARKMTLLELVQQLENLPQDDDHEIWCIPFDKYGFRLEAKPKDYFVYLKSHNPLATERYRVDFFTHSAIAQLPADQFDNMVWWECSHRAAKALHELQHAHPRSVIRMKAWERTEVALGIRFRCDIEVYGQGKE